MTKILTTFSVGCLVSLLSSCGEKQPTSSASDSEAQQSQTVSKDQQAKDKAPDKKDTPAAAPK